MTQQPYSYVVLRYVPDQGAGEGLNIGVAVYCQQTGQFGYKVDSHYERLSGAFARFDGQAFRRTVSNLLHAFRDAERSFSTAPLFSGDRSLIEWLRALIPDVGGSLTFTPPRHGLAEDLHEEVAVLFDRMVQSQKATNDDAPRRDDSQVWRTYQKALSPKVSNALRSKSFTTETVKVDFEHAIKNGAWHVIQPISMDYKQAESIQRKASQWAGTAMGLEAAADLGTIFFLLGEPAAHRIAYDRARALLDRVRINHEIIEERDADSFNRRLLALMEHSTD